MKAFQELLNRAGYEIHRMPGRRMSGPPLPTLDRSNPDMYDQDGLRTVHGHDFADDRTFREAYDYAFNATKADPGHHGPWRVHVAMWATKTALRRQGDFVECGTARAFVSTAILKYTNWNETSNGRHFYLLDTFEGIVEELLTDREREMGPTHWRHGIRYQNNYPDALRNVSPFKNVQLVKGIVPNILPQIPARQVAYLHLDMPLPSLRWPLLSIFGRRLSSAALSCSMTTPMQAMNRCARPIMSWLRASAWKSLIYRQVRDYLLNNPRR